MAFGDAYVFPGFLTPVLTQLFFLKPPTTFLICFCRGERRKYAGKKSRLNWRSNSQPPGHVSDTLTTEPPGWGWSNLKLSSANSFSLEESKFVGESLKFDPRLWRLFFLALQKHVRKVVGVFGKKSCVSTGVRKARKHICVTDRHDMTSAVKVALNPYTTNQL